MRNSIYNIIPGKIVSQTILLYVYSTGKIFIFYKTLKSYEETNRKL